LATPEQPITEPHSRSFTVNLTVSLETDDVAPTVADVQDALEQAFILPPTLDVDGATIAVPGAHTEAALEMVFSPPPDPGKYGR
jgi:hypothetical protein